MSRILPKSFLIYSLKRIVTEFPCQTEAVWQLKINLQMIAIDVYCTTTITRNSPSQESDLISRAIWASQPVSIINFSFVMWFKMIPKHTHLFPCKLSPEFIVTPTSLISWNLCCHLYGVILSVNQKWLRWKQEQFNRDCTDY